MSNLHVVVDRERVEAPRARSFDLVPASIVHARGAQPPLVIALHASTGSQRQWRALGDALAPACDLVGVDLHGHGTGPAWSDSRPLRLLDDARLVMPLAAAAAAAGRDVHLMGHSYGGTVALKVAAMMSGALRSVAVYEPVVLRVLMDDADRDDEAREMIAVPEAMRAHVGRGDTAEAARVFIDFWSGRGSWSALPETAKSSIASRMPVVLQQFGALFAERRQVAALEALALPVLVLTGERTVRPALRIAERLRRLLPKAAHETLPGMGHMGPVTHAGDVNRRLCGFVASTSPAWRGAALDRHDCRGSSGTSSARQRVSSACA